MKLLIIEVLSKLLSPVLNCVCACKVHTYTYTHGHIHGHTHTYPSLCGSKLASNVLMLINKKIFKTKNLLSLQSCMLSFYSLTDKIYPQSNHAHAAKNKKKTKKTSTIGIYLKFRNTSTVISLILYTTCCFGADAVYFDIKHKDPNT